jgi:transposase
MRPNEIGTVCYVRFGTRPHDRTIRRALEGQPAAIRMFGRFEPYHDIPDVIERRKAIVALHSEGWNVKSIAGYLKTSRPTVYRTLNKWFTEGVLGLEDKPRGGIWKTDLRAMNEVRKLQENPELGAFRISAALEQMGIYLSPRTCGRILAVNRELYGLEKPKRGPKEKKEMPFYSKKRHEIWTVDIRYIGHNVTEENNLYAISVLENHSRALLASSISRGKDLTAYLSVLHSAVSRLREVKGPRLFTTRYAPLQLRLFELSDALGETGWLKALRMDEYAPRLSRAQGSAQQTLFPYAEAL